MTNAVDNRRLAAAADVQAPRPRSPQRATAADVHAPRLSSPLRELLVWVAREPRTYGAAMDAWRSSCARFSVWEDALDARLIEVKSANGHGAAEALVRLTPVGRSALREARA